MGMAYFQKHSNLLLKMEVLDKDLESDLRKFFTVHTKEFDQDAGSSKRIPVEVIEKDEKYVYIPITFAQCVADYLYKCGHQVTSEKLDIDMIPHFKVDDYWYEFFSGREGQAELFDTIIQNTRGVVQLPTGFGKSVFIISIAESLDEDGNILIIVPFNSIKEELISRFKARNIEISPQFDISKRINIINAPGYCNSNKYDDPACKEWMSKVKMVEIDECENVNESQRDILVNQTLNAKYILGYSASANKLEGSELKVDKDLLYNFNIPSYGVAKYVGLSLVYKKPSKPLDLHQLNSTFNFLRYNKYRGPYVAFPASIKAVIENDNFKVCLRYALEHKREILCIPVNTIKSGDYIYKLVLDMGYHPVMWSANRFVSEYDDIKNYQSLKDRCKNQPGSVDVIIFSKVAFMGVDLHQMSDILIVVGTQYNTIIQPLGRCFRHEHPSCWLIQEVIEKKNSIFRNCTFKRLNIIKKTYNCNFINHSYNELEEFRKQIEIKTSDMR